MGRQGDGPELARATQAHASWTSLYHFHICLIVVVGRVQNGCRPGGGATSSLSPARPPAKNHLCRAARARRFWRLRLVRGLSAQPFHLGQCRMISACRILSLRFVCQACGHRGADIRPDFHWNRTEVGGLGSRLQHNDSVVTLQGPPIWLALEAGIGRSGARWYVPSNVKGGHDG
jgi:hypothetical protein